MHEHGRRRTLRPRGNPPEASAQAQLNNTVGASLFSDGTGSGGKELTGLKVLISDTPTSAGTVGGIDQVANAFWQNKVIGSGTVGTVSSTTVQGFMDQQWLSIIRGTDRPDLYRGGFCLVHGLLAEPAGHPAHH